MHSRIVGIVAMRVPATRMRQDRVAPHRRGQSVVTGFSVSCSIRIRAQSQPMKIQADLSAASGATANLLSDHDRLARKVLAGLVERAAGLVADPLRSAAPWVVLCADVVRPRAALAPATVPAGAADVLAAAPCPRDATRLEAGVLRPATLQVAARTDVGRGAADAAAALAAGAADPRDRCTIGRARRAGAALGGVRTGAPLWNERRGDADSVAALLVRGGAAYGPAARRLPAQADAGTVDAAAAAEATGDTPLLPPFPPLPFLVLRVGRGPRQQPEHAADDPGQRAAAGGDPQCHRQVVEGVLGHLGTPGGRMRRVRNPM